MAAVDQDQLLVKFKELRSTTLKTNDPALRKRAIQSLSDMIPSPYMPVNAAVIDFLEKMFRIYPDLQELIINASWNMIEEPKAEVWLAGIKFITALSKAAPDRWVRKNVDVFIQMFAFLDDQNDFNRVYEALGEHMAINTPVTLDVLCACLDSSKPIGTLDPAADPQAIRTRILDFLVLREDDIGRLNKLQVATYHRALLKALPSSTAQELSIIVMGLFHEPLSDELQDRLLQTLLQRAQSALSEPSQVEDAMNASEMAYDVYKRHGSQLRDRALLWGYYGSETSLKLRPTLSPANQVKMVDRLADVIDVDPSKMDQQLANDYVIHRNRAADDIDDWKRVILTSNDQLWKAATPLLKAVLQKVVHACRDTLGWKPDEMALQKLNDRLMSPNMRSTVRPLASLARAVLQDIDQTLKSRMEIFKEQAVVSSPPIERPSSVSGKRKAEDLQKDDYPISNARISQVPYDGSTPSPLPKEPPNAIARKGSALLARMNSTPRSLPVPIPTVVSTAMASTSSQVEPGRPSKRPKQSDDFVKPNALRASNLHSRISGGPSDSSRDALLPRPITPLEARPNLASRLSVSTNSAHSAPRASPPTPILPPNPTPPAEKPLIQATTNSITPSPALTSAVKPSLSILGIASNPTPNRTKAVQVPSNPQVIPSPLLSPALNTISGPFSGLNIRGAASKSASARGSLSFQKALQDLSPVSTPPISTEAKQKTRPAISVRSSSSSLLARFTDGNANRPSASSTPSLRDRMR